MASTTHSTRTRNNICASVNADVNSGTTTSGGRLVIRNSDMVALVEFQLSNPAFHTPSGGTMQLNISGASVPTVSGVAAWGEIVDRDGSLVVRTDVTVSGGGGGLTALPTTTITAGVPLALTGSPLSYSAPS